ncbi:hypothetical protein ACFV9D_06955 [Streptomyces sp. NPDC059875]|uniref:hypothetical protein n=1 Tax=unclassified Streptomyces TaxID=2593676 RepID=UPI00365AB6CB
MAEEERVSGYEFYGTEPDYLPAFMNDAGDPDGRRVRKLTAEETRELRGESLSRFPVAGGADLDWSRIPYTAREMCETDEDWVRVATEYLSPYVGEGQSAVIFWGDLSMPDVEMPVEVAIRRAEDLMGADMHFWIHPLGAPVLIEYLQDGRVTVATIPSE